MQLKDLKEYAKGKGYSGYSKLRVQELRNFIISKAPVKRGQKTPARAGTASKRPGISIKNSVLTRLLNVAKKDATNNTSKKLGYVVLSSLYKDHPETQLKKYINMENTNYEEFIKKQHEIITKKTARLETNNTDVNIPMDEHKIQDLFMMLWIDMSHDELFKGTFKEFLISSIKNVFTNKPITIKNTTLLQIFINNKILSNPSGGLKIESHVEKKLKKLVHDIWGDPSIPPLTVKKTASILSIVKDKSKPIYVSYDAENSDFITSIMDKSRNENTGRYYLKRIFTIANLMDPGRGASKNQGGQGRSGGSINKLIDRIFDEEPSTPYKFNYQLFKFKFGDYFTIEIIPDGTTFNAKLNDEKLNMRVKRKDAIKGNDIDKISKTFGDFIQIMTVAHMRKSGLNVVSTSQDGGFVGMTGFVQSNLFGINPAIIMDATTVIGVGNRGETGIQFIGLGEYFKNNTIPTRSGVTTRFK